MTTAAIYVRVSTGGQEDGTSLDTQEERCRQYAAEQGYAVAEVYREVHTGTELWERPKLTELRERIRRREVAAVIAYAIDRLSRDPVHLGVLLSEADHAGVPVLFVSEPLDNSPEGQLIRFVRGYAAKVEHEKIKERTARGRIALAKAGRPIIGCRPLYGYAWNADQSALVPDPATGPVVRRIFAEAAAGTPLRAIAAGLSADGIPTPTRSPRGWNHASVYTILGHPSYVGRAAAFRYQRVRNAGNGRTSKLRPDDQTIPLAGVAPALVDEATFALIGERLARNKAAAARNNRFPNATLLRGGFARCGYCGGNLTTQRSSDRQSWRYVCDAPSRRHLDCRGLSIKADTLDAAAWARVAEIVTRPDLIAAKLEEMCADDPTAADLAALDRRIEAIERQSANLARRLALLDDDDAAAILARELESLAAQRRQLLAEREQVRARRGQWEAAQSRLGELTTWCNEVRYQLDELDHAGRRDLLFALDVKATIRRKGDEPRVVVSADVPLERRADPEIVSKTGSCLLSKRRR